MSNRQENDSSVTVKAINVETGKVICEGHDGDEVIRKAKNSGENYILDFETDPRYHFLF